MENNIVNTYPKVYIKNLNIKNKDKNIDKQNIVDIYPLVYPLIN